MKRAVLYLRVSTVDQHPETPLFDLRQMAAQRGYEIVREYTDRIGGAKAHQPRAGRADAGRPPRPLAESPSPSCKTRAFRTSNALPSATGVGL